MRRPGRQVVLAAASVGSGTIVGALTNLLTGSWNWALAGGLVAAVALWMSVEMTRAATAGNGVIRVVQRVRRRVLGKVIGVRRSGEVASADIRQDVDEVGKGGEVIGYDGT
ncbi:hypothetical protein ACQPYK_18250 [Streptosporangium sp. CA-135522]|uniref:hypothetical protein n=1 Tax=Streptosporangium sp. CA-135522 TaxID=3240072 RepID=UPI003D8C28FE